MSRTYSATNHRYSFAVTPSIGGNSNATLFAGWFLPTTLTAGRGYWSAGATTGLEVGGTTSEVVGRVQANTTNSVYTSSGAGIVVGNWYFIAHFISCTNTGPNVDHYLWIGTINSAPVPVTFTQTTQPVGTITAQTTAIVGNKGAAGTVSFQGDIGNCWFGIQSTNSFGPFNLFSPGNTGYGPTGKSAEIINNEKEGLLKNFVLPLWNGETFPTRAFDYAFSGTTGNLFGMYAIPFDAGGATTQTTGLTLNSGAGLSPFALTVNGTAVSQNRTPRGGMLEANLPYTQTW